MVAAWFASAGLRADAADTFRAESEAAVETADYGKAYQRAKYTAALDGSSENLIAYGGAAALANHFDEAIEAFSQAYEEQPSREAARGQLAAAARGGNRAEAVAAAEQLSTPADAFERALLVHALVAAGDLAAARSEFDDEPESSPEAAARAIATAPDDQAAALSLLALTGLGGVNPPNDPPALKKLEVDTISLPPEARLKLTTTVTAMQRPASSATRQLLLAERLTEFNRLYPAEQLADQAVHDEPGYRDAWNTLAATQLDLGDLPGASQSLKISERLDEAYGYTWYLKSVLAERQDKTDDAKRFRERADLLGYRP